MRRATTIWGIGVDELFVETHICGTVEMGTEISGAYRGAVEISIKIATHVYGAGPWWFNIWDQTLNVLIVAHSNINMLLYITNCARYQIEICLLGAEEHKEGRNALVSAICFSQITECIMNLHMKQLDFYMVRSILGGPLKMRLI